MDQIRHLLTTLLKNVINTKYNKYKHKLTIPYVSLNKQQGLDLNK